MATTNEDPKYHPVDNFDSESYDDKSSGDETRRPAYLTSLYNEISQNLRFRSDDRCLDTPRRRLSSFYIIVTFVNILLFSTSLAILLFSKQDFRSLEKNSKNRLVQMTSSYTPIFEKLKIDLMTSTSNGSFWPQNPPSIYQLPPSPEVDAAWSRLADTHSIAITESEVRKLGRDPTELWSFPSSYHIPGHQLDHQYKLYMALPNVFHQIHCLDIFRKLAHPTVYGEFWTHTSDFPFQEHVGHCQYLLLQTVMCHSDLELVTFNKVKGTPGPFPEFSVEQKCRDFDSVLRWKEENQINVTDEEWKEIMVTPEGIRELEPEGRTIPFV